MTLILLAVSDGVLRQDNPNLTIHRNRCAIQFLRFNSDGC